MPTAHDEREDFRIAVDARHERLESTGSSCVDASLDQFQHEIARHRSRSSQSPVAGTSLGSANDHKDPPRSETSSIFISNKAVAFLKGLALPPAVDIPLGADATRLARDSTCHSPETLDLPRSPAVASIFEVGSHLPQDSQQPPKRSDLDPRSLSPPNV